MTDKQKSVRIVTPAGKARYPRLNKPDTKFVPEGEYSTKLILTAEDLALPLKSKDATVNGKTIQELIDSLIDAKFAEQKAAMLADPKSKVKAGKLGKAESPVKDDIDPETGESTGNSYINFKMKAVVTPKNKPSFTQKPALFDAKGNKLAPTVSVWGGSTIKVSAELFAYYTPKDNVVGVSCRLRGAQVIELVSGGDGNAESMGFGEEEGYVFSDAAAEGADHAGEGDGDKIDF